MQPKFTLKNKFRVLGRLPALLLVFCMFGELRTSNAQCTWTASTNYPINVMDQAVVSLGSNLYSFAGVSANAVIATSYKFDGTTWTPIAPLPDAREYAGATTDGTNIYIMGGATAAGTISNTVYRYNVATNDYTTLASFTTAVWNPSVVYLNGKIHKFGGNTAAAPTTVHEIYDVATNTWSAGAAYPAALGFMSSFAQGGFIYSAGGFGAAASAKAYRYTQATNTWDDAGMADLPVDRWGSAHGFYNDGFVVAGGYVGGSISNTALIWDPLGNVWNTLPNALLTRSRFAGGVVAGSFFAIGGRLDNTFAGTNNNQKLNCLVLPPCSGTPTPGNTISTPNPVCPSVNFTLSPENLTGPGATFQWQQSPDGTSWSDIGGAIGQTHTRSQTTATYYRVVVTCGANSAPSTGLLVPIAPTTSCYCIPTATQTALEKIGRVQFNTINNPSTSTAGFEDFTSISTNMIKGQTFPITVTIAPSPFSQDVVRVWIDLNIDGDFTDAGEMLYTSPRGVGPHTGNITLPLTASTGTTRMRVRLWDASVVGENEASVGPCGNTTWGQTEDYTINMQPCVQGAFTTHPANTTIQCSNNASFSVATTGSALVYSWQYRVNAASPWLDVPNSGIYSGANTAQLVLLNVPQTMSGYQYRALISGPCTAVDFSNAATLTVNTLVATVTPTTATICNGSIQQLTLTNPTSTPVYGSPSGLPATIPDANATGINSTISVSNVPPGAVVSNVSVTLNITHAWVSDLEIVLRAPNGQIINLSDLVSGTNQSGANFINTVFSSSGVNAISTGVRPGYTGTFKADAIPGPTGAFGVPAGPTGFLPTTTTWSSLYSTLNGNWTIAMYDAGAPDVGVLTGWSLNITYVAPPAQGVWTATPSSASNTMFTDAAATIPYVAGTPANTIYVKPTANTVYSVVYTTTTPCVSAATNIPVNVVNPPSAVVNPVDRSACIGGNATFTASATGGPFTYQWEVSTDGGASYTNIAGATSATLNLTGVTQTMNNNLYRLKFNSPPCVGPNPPTAAARLTVNPLPVVTLSASSTAITPGQTTTLSATSVPGAQNATSWTWFYNGSQIVTTPPTNTSSIVRNIDQLGSYEVRVTDVNGCVSTSNTVVIGGQASDNLWIYPNPTDGQFQVRVFFDGPNADIRHVMIYNEQGQLVLRKAFDLFVPQTPYLQMTFDMSAFPAGTYVVKAEERFSGKIKSGLLIIQ